MRGKGPKLLAGGPVETVKFLVARSDDDLLLRDGRRGKERRVVLLRAPKDIGVGEVEAEDFIGIMADVGMVAGDGRGTGNVSAGFDRREFLARGGIEDVEFAVATPRIQFCRRPPPVRR